MLKPSQENNSENTNPKKDLFYVGPLITAGGRPRKRQTTSTPLFLVVAARPRGGGVVTRQTWTCTPTWTCAYQCLESGNAGVCSNTVAAQQTLSRSARELYLREGLIQGFRQRSTLRGTHSLAFVQVQSQFLCLLTANVGITWHSDWEQVLAYSHFS